MERWKHWNLWVYGYDTGDADLLEDFRTLPTFNYQDLTGRARPFWLNFMFSRFPDNGEWLASIIQKEVFDEDFPDLPAGVGDWSELGFIMVTDLVPGSVIDGFEVDARKVLTDNVGLDTEEFALKRYRTVGGDYYLGLFRTFGKSRKVTARDRCNTQVALQS